MADSLSIKSNPFVVRIRDGKDWYPIVGPANDTTYGISKLYDSPDSSLNAASGMTALTPAALHNALLRWNDRY